MSRSIRELPINIESINGGLYYLLTCQQAKNLINNLERKAEMVGQTIQEMLKKAQGGSITYATFLRIKEMAFQSYTKIWMLRTVRQRNYSYVSGKIKIAGSTLTRIAQLLGQTNENSVKPLKIKDLRENNVASLAQAAQTSEQTLPTLTFPMSHFQYKLANGLLTVQPK